MTRYPVRAAPGKIQQSMTNAEEPSSMVFFAGCQGSGKACHDIKMEFWQSLEGQPGVQSWFTGKSRPQEQNRL